MNAAKGEATNVGKRWWLQFETALVGTSHRPQWCAVKEGSDVIKIYMTTLPR